MKFVSLESICTAIIDCPHSTPKWRNSGIPVVRNYNLINGHIDLSNLSYVDEETYEDRIKRAKPESGDIIISREAPMGVVGIVPDNFKCCLGQRLVLLKIDRSKCDPLYVLYALLSNTVQAQINRIDLTGSIVSNLNIPDLKKLQIPIVTGDTTKTASVLDTLDAKIDNNSAISEQLESMAKTIYNYWFLQFEFPNEKGKPYKSSGGKMVWNEDLQREIPEGWELENLYHNSLSKLIKPGIEKFEGGKRYLATADVNGNLYGQGSIILYESRETRANMQPSINSIWFAKMKNSIKHLLVDKSMTSMVDNTILSTGFCGLQCDENSFEYLASFIESDFFEKTKDSHAHGATQQAVNNTDLQSIALLVPSKDVVMQYHQLTSKMFEMMSSNKIENERLKSLRNFLLPLLMNGQISVADTYS